MEKYSQFRDRGKAQRRIVIWGPPAKLIFRIWHCTFPPHHLAIFQTLSTDPPLPLHREASTLPGDRYGILSRSAMATPRRALQESYAVGYPRSPRHLVDRLAD